MDTLVLLVIAVPVACFGIAVVHRLVTGPPELRGHRAPTSGHVPYATDRPGGPRDAGAPMNGHAHGPQHFGGPGQ